MSEPPPDGASKRFELVSDFKPTGDQPRAIEELVGGLEEGLRGRGWQLRAPPLRWAGQCGHRTGHALRLERLR